MANGNPTSQVSERRRAREKERIQRKLQLAENNVVQFEDTLSGHELNLMRLEALPESLRGSDYKTLLDNEKKSIQQLEHSIEQTLREIERLGGDVGDTVSS